MKATTSKRQQIRLRSSIGKLIVESSQSQKVIFDNGESDGIVLGICNISWTFCVLHPRAHEKPVSGQKLRNQTRGKGTHLYDVSSYNNQGINISPKVRTAATPAANTTTLVAIAKLPGSFSGAQISRFMNWENADWSPSIPSMPPCVTAERE
jgi:hypothetical protein